MKREIKFRGQMATGEWGYGLPHLDLKGSTVYWNPETGGQSNAPIKNGTLSQYTGMKDKNGIEIYEGDIISRKEHKEQSNWASEMVHKPDNYIEVAFINGSFCNVYTELALSDFLTSIVTHKVEYEVIGNIYENAELLNGQPNNDTQCGVGGYCI